MTRITDYLKAYYRVCRLEYAPGEIPAMLTVLFLGSQTISRFFDFVVIEALLAFVLLYLSGFIINAITDKEIDKQYDTFKTSIPKSVDILGERTLWGVIAGHVIVSVVLALHISLQMASYVPIALVLLGVFFGLGYSVKPFHFKVRGIWHAIALGSSAFLLPFLFLMFVVAQGIPQNLLIFILGFSFVHYGMEFGNQAIDYIEDKASNVRTPPVRWGMKRSLRIALGCVLAGIIVEAYALYFVLLSRGSFTFILPILTTNVVYALLMTIILAGYFIPTKGLRDMLATLNESESIEKGMPRLKKICNYAKWQTSGILGVAFVSAILFLGVLYSPSSQVTPGSNEPSGSSHGQLGFAETPRVEFFDEGDSWMANMSISIKNDNTQRDQGRMMVMIQSWVANILIKAKSILLEYDLAPRAYWNFSSQVFAHDNDDTSFKLYIMLDRSGNGDFLRVGNPLIIPSQKDLYIYKVSAVGYEDVLHNKQANVTVTIYNEGNTKYIGDLYVEVWYYYLGYYDYASSENDRAIHANENWIPTLTLKALKLDEITPPTFVVNLYYNGDKVDEYTLHGY